MKKLISILLAVAMILALAGCGGAPKATASSDISGGTDTSANPEVSDGNSSVDVPSTGSPVADSYTAYSTAKNNMVTRLSDGLTQNQDTAFAALTLLGVTTADLAILPVSLFGMGKDAVEMGLGFLGATGVDYSENGNAYKVTYTDKDGAKYDFSGTYDPAKDALVCTASKDGKEAIYVEYVKTSYGYAAQYFFNNDDGTVTLYQVTVSGQDGVLGLSTDSGKPAPLTGSEPADFPKTCSQWYAVTGLTITGVGSDGKEINFEFTPTPSASN